ncbi:hypothetical protein D3C71_1470920 [compost metagenome]
MFLFCGHRREVELDAVIRNWRGDSNADRVDDLRGSALGRRAFQVSVEIDVLRRAEQVAVIIGREHDAALEHERWGDRGHRNPVEQALLCIETNVGLHVLLRFPG